MEAQQGRRVGSRRSPPGVCDVTGQERFLPLQLRLALGGLSA
ncbi:hypothetical protein D187_005695 [Cystobacter fuscus DSM 2262]|uniref:Uncharacterized protein n=1 Tax=Cystobacter fuscus (strain ATCC 25194 / DSM 2262 / NBRC 100088 / M29) TaxID=1242864 RepID=S9QPP5_CYSF2|nr:hypothetical protein D187_005695 [Cystobacter fuscus DSM 2262]